MKQAEFIMLHEQQVITNTQVVFRNEARLGLHIVDRVHHDDDDDYSVYYRLLGHASHSRSHPRLQVLAP